MNMYLKYVPLTMFWWFLVVTGNAVRNEDICGPNNGKRVYLELGKKGILHARNVTFVTGKSPRRVVPRLYANIVNSSHLYQCNLELITCPSCVIIAVFKNIALPRHCGDGVRAMDSPCRCDYVWLSEPPYEDVSGSPFCGSYIPITYRSSTRTLSINLLYSHSYKHAFTIEYSAERNRLHLKGAETTPGVPTKGPNGTSDGGILSSPFFPARYPRDLGLEYVITCPSKSPSCRIRLLFSDFQLATVSVMEFYDWNGQRLDVSSGARFRPPVIVTSGPSLLIRFYANGGTGLGYKAFYSFVIGYIGYNKSVQPITDCGGYVENLGGAITMMNMVGRGVKAYDCVWLIRPPKNFLHTKTHMYLKVVGFGGMAGNTELIIRQGPTSALVSLEAIRHSAGQLQPLRRREHIAPISSGFHVGLRGTFGPSSHLAIAYAAFSYTDCFTDTDFPCLNHRCIPSQLNCDGFDHCGDNSDEPMTCFQDWQAEPRDRKWHVNKANYYFPKIDRYPDLKTATLVFVASSFGLIVLISALIIVLYRVGARARHQRELQSRLETISELLDGARVDEISISSDDPPDYEAPPGYEEVTKLALPKKARCSSSRKFDGNSASRHDEDANSSVVLESDDHGSQTIPTVVSEENSRHAPRIPESPPPPYITPPESAKGNHTTNLVGLSASMRHVCPLRRTWLRRSAQYPPSADCAPANGPANGHSSSSTDVDTLDSTRASDISSNTNGHYQRDSRPTVRELGNATLASNENVRYVPERASKRSRRIIDEADGRDTNCLCEGAEGGCSITASNPPVCHFSTTEQSTLNETLDSKREQTVASLAGETDDCREEDSSDSSKDSIVGLLDSCKPIKPSLHQSASWTMASSPYGTLPRSSGKFSRDNLGRISAISTRNSYEKLQDEFEIVPDRIVFGKVERTCSTMASTWSDDASRSVAINRRYSSCVDVDSLYEGIEILDAFLARRSSDHGCHQSVAVMLFGTPRHNFARDRAATSQRTTKGKRMRVWRSSENALSN